jgi:tRNA-specific 2-thiouridylase
VDCGFPHTILDIRDEFKGFIIDNFVEEYMAGRTPNPCVLCNTHIKWEALLKRADMLNCDFIATGHYAQVREVEGRFVVSKGLDESKDQSYVLWGVTQECLKRTIFPMGEYHKKDIKQMALDRGYKALAEKNESYDICFIPDNDYRGFLKRRVEGLEEKVKGGNFITISGEVVGTHDGYPFYTIGQRKIGISLGKNPTFVIGINPEDNTVTVGAKEDLQKQEMHIRNVNYLKYDKIEDGKEYVVKVRYKHKGEMATITNEGENLKVLFHNKVEGIAPGQSAAIYEGDDLIAGGFIMKM